MDPNSLVEYRILLIKGEDDKLYYLIYYYLSFEIKMITIVNSLNCAFELIQRHLKEDD